MIRHYNSKRDCLINLKDFEKEKEDNSSAEMFRLMYPSLNIDFEKALEHPYLIEQELEKQK